MDRNQAKDFSPILQAFAEGKEIECRNEPDSIKDLGLPNDWTNVTDLFFMKGLEYRIKSESQYRPFANAEECWQEMLKHQPFGWIKAKEGAYFNIIYVDDYYAGFADKDGSAILLASKNSYQDNTFIDGTPFGVKVEE